jgi:hypothetical protein
MMQQARAYQCGCHVLIMRPDSHFGKCDNETPGSINGWHPEDCGEIIEGGPPSAQNIDKHDATHRYDGKITLLNQDPNSFQVYSQMRPCGALAKHGCYDSTKDLSFSAPENRDALQKACRSLQSQLGWSNDKLKTPIELPMLIYREKESALLPMRLWKHPKNFALDCSEFGVSNPGEMKTPTVDASQHANTVGLASSMIHAAQGLLSGNTTNDSGENLANLQAAVADDGSINRNLDKQGAKADGKSLMASGLGADGSSGGSAPSYFGASNGISDGGALDNANSNQEDKVKSASASGSSDIGKMKAGKGAGSSSNGGGSSWGSLFGANGSGNSLTGGSDEISFGKKRDLASNNINPMGSADPENYFSLLNAQANLFKVVEHRYRMKTTTW